MVNDFGEREQSVNVIGKYHMNNEAALGTRQKAYKNKESEMANLNHHKLERFKTDFLHFKSTVDSKVQIISWNILANQYLRYQEHINYSHGEREILLRSTLQHFAELGTDFICLQEVDVKLALETFEASHTRLRTPTGHGHYGGHGVRVDACCIFFKTSAWKELSHRIIHMDDLVDGSNEEFRTYFQRNNFGIVAKFEHRSTGKTIVLSNTHLYWDPKYEFVKLCQAHYLCHQIKEFLEDTGCNDVPIIFSGDLNSLPDSAVYKYLTQGKVLYDWKSQNDILRLMRKRGGTDYGKINPITWLQEEIFCPFIFQSSYAPKSDNHFSFTNITPSFQGCIDYILFQPAKLVQVSKLPLPKSTEVLKRYHNSDCLPNHVWPSDHLAVGSVFGFKGQQIDDQRSRCRPPLDVNRAVKHIGRRIRSKFGCIPFAVAGSYPAAIKAYEHDPSFLLKYNDIDVFIRHQGSTTNKQMWTSPDYMYEDAVIPNIVTITNEEGVIPRSKIKMNLISLKADDNQSASSDCLSLEGLIKGFDTNAVMVGFIATWNGQKVRKCTNNDWKESCSFSWKTSFSFRQFLETKILKIDDVTTLERPASALVRLLYKAQQLELRYELPPEDTLLKTLHERCMGEPTMKKFRKLRHPYQSELTDRFRIGNPFTSRRFKTRLYSLYSVQRGGILSSSEESSDDASCDSSDDPNDYSSDESSDGVDNLSARFAARSFFGI